MAGLKNPPYTPGHPLYQGLHKRNRSDRSDDLESLQPPQPRKKLFRFPLPPTGTSSKKARKASSSTATTKYLPLPPPTRSKVKAPLKSTEELLGKNPVVLELALKLRLDLGYPDENGNARPVPALCGGNLTVKKYIEQNIEYCYHELGLSPVSVIRFYEIL